MQKKEIDRINELARKAKTEGLTEAETAERDELRRRYIADIRAAVQDQLAHTIVQEPDGTRHPLLKKGGTEHPMVLYKRFKGSEPAIDALLERNGIKKK